MCLTYWAGHTTAPIDLDSNLTTHRALVVMKVEDRVDKCADATRILAATTLVADVVARDATLTVHTSAGSGLLEPDTTRDPRLELFAGGGVVDKSRVDVRRTTGCHEGRLRYPVHLHHIVGISAYTPLANTTSAGLSDIVGDIIEAPATSEILKLRCGHD